MSTDSRMHPGFFLATCGVATVLATIAALAAVSFMSPSTEPADSQIVLANAARDRAALETKVHELASSVRRRERQSELSQISRERNHRLPAHRRCSRDHTTAGRSCCRG